MKLRSQPVQRELPRPLDVNMANLRPLNSADTPLTELQRVSVASVTSILTSGSLKCLIRP